MKGARSQGAEGEISREPLARLEPDAQRTHFNVKDRNGARVNPDIARSQMRLFTTCRLPGALSGLSLGGGTIWQSRVTSATGPYHSAPPVSATCSQKGHVLANLMARYELTEKVAVQVNLNNLFDPQYLASSGVFAEPRNVRFVARKSF